MITKSVRIIAVVFVLAFVGTSAFAYDFWGVNVGTASYMNSTHLTFSGAAASGAQYVVGGYKYTQVDGTWLGAFAAASPGEGYLAARRSDAQGLFFKADSDYARFMVITGAAQYGAPATELGYGARLFGPGDLKIDVGGNTYGVGMRLSNLTWAVSPSTTNKEFKVWHNGTVDSIYSRDAGTLGTVELNPRWNRMGNSSLSATSDLCSAFFVSGSGSSVGSATVNFADTGITMCGAKVFAYEVAVPWTTLGLDSDNYDFHASWRPDCGNDVIGSDFALRTDVPNSVPEPTAMAGMISGLVGLFFARRRK